MATCSPRVSTFPRHIASTTLYFHEVVGQSRDMWPGLPHWKHTLTLGVVGQLREKWPVLPQW